MNLNRLLFHFCFNKIKITIYSSNIKRDVALKRISITLTYVYGLHIIFKDKSCSTFYNFTKIANSPDSKLFDCIHVRRKRLCHEHWRSKQFARCLVWSGVIDKDKDYVSLQNILKNFWVISFSSRLPSGKIVMRKAAGGPPSSDENSSSPRLRYFSPLRRRRMTVSLPEATDRVGNKSS